MDADQALMSYPRLFAFIFGLKTSGATHRAVIAGFAAGLDTARFLVLKEVDKL
jgi:hypothetical protein